MERKDAITFGGSPLTLVGKEVVIGDNAPNFTVVKTDLSPLSLKDFPGKTIVISAMPSIDTPVCEIQTIRFNKEVEKLDGVILLTISMDLPFALNRFCGAKDIKNAITTSDYKDREFSHNYGLYIKELGLISRAVIIIDKNGKIKYTEYLKEITEEPNYNEALKVLKNL
ncbi:thiol peroxidase [uncultured Cetobacterium sp.]|uniref:thiol peroxidase n=1 Tax=uncultured Cetobacterium sp. TaxID=527638 RepID=UPI00262D9ED6|nr:thiol peroxidase [uncultured Cetobacterium sp.]